MDAREAVRVAISQGVLQQQALKAIKPVEPSRSRSVTLKALAAALADNAVVMDYLHTIFTENNGKLGSHTLEDFLGGLFMVWRGIHEVQDQGEWEDSLSTDPILKSELEKRLKKYAPQGAEVSGLEAFDRDELERLLMQFRFAIKGLQSFYGKEESLQKAKDLLVEINKVVNGIQL
jgi:hypothetical protein